MAEAQQIENTALRGRAPQALYLSSGEQRLFGWLHHSQASEQSDVGVVLCNPFGYEAICSHRGIRAFAEAISAAGMPALRFDYLGTGDSADIEPGADQIHVWTQDIFAAVEQLKVATGVQRVCLLGFRLGSLLATLAASQRDFFCGLVLIAPIFSGRRYLRELRTVRMAAALTQDQPDASSEKQDTSGGDMEVSGFSLSAASLSTLAKLDMTTLGSSFRPEILVIDGTKAPTVHDWPKPAELQRQTTRLALPGLVEMLMTPPQFALVPKEVITATVGWLLKLSVRDSGIPDTAGRRPVTQAESVALDQLTLPPNARVEGIVVTERLVSFGKEQLLFGIVTQPPPGEIRRRAVILLNAGADHHIGASRLHVSMARRWAQHGYVVLRMDLAGLGDSGTRAGRAEDEVFPEEALTDIHAAIDLLRGSYGVSDVTLAGLCSGAYHALRAAVAGLPVSRIIMVNPQNYFWKPGETLRGLQLAEVVHNPGVYRKRILSLAAWKRMVTGNVNILRIVKIYLQRPLLAAESTLRDIARHMRVRLPNDLGTELEEIVARGIRVVFVFAKGEPGIGLLNLQAGNSVKRLAQRCRIHTVNSGDHVFTRSAPRAIMEQIVSNELFARLDRQERSGAGVESAVEVE